MRDASRTRLKTDQQTKRECGRGLTPAADSHKPGPSLSHAELFDLRLSACVVQLLLDSFSISLGNAVLNNRGHTFDQVFRFLQAQTGDFTDDLNDANLVRAKAGHVHGEFGLLFYDRSSSSRTGSSSRHRSSSGYAKFIFHELHEINDLENSHVRNCIKDLFLRCGHVNLQKN